MARFVTVNAIDALLDYIINKADKELVCAGQPATYYEAADPTAWTASTAYSLGDAVRPTTRNGFNYECTVAGTSDSVEPTWPTTAGLTVVDGTVTWTARAAKCLSEGAALTAVDFTKADGDVSGRKFTLAEKSDIPVHTSGTGDHVAVVDDTAKELLIATVCASQSVTQGSTATMPAWDHEVEDPVAP